MKNNQITMKIKQCDAVKKDQTSCNRIAMKNSDKCSLHSNHKPQITHLENKEEVKEWNETQKERC